jgi:hypothetical protein
VAHIHNSLLQTASEDLSAFVHPITNTPIQGFLVKPRDIGIMSKETLNSLLNNLGLVTVDESKPLKQQRLRSHIGLRADPISHAQVERSDCRCAAGSGLALPDRTTRPLAALAGYKEPAAPRSPPSLCLFCPLLLLTSFASLPASPPFWLAAPPPPRRRLRAPQHHSVRR